MLTLLLALGCTTEPTPAPAEIVPAATPAPTEAGQYVCPMHPEITSTEPGECSECGMDLVKQEVQDHSSHEHGEKPKTTTGDHDGH